MEWRLVRGAEQDEDGRERRRKWRRRKRWRGKRKRRQNKTRERKWRIHGGFLKNRKLLMTSSLLSYERERER